MEERKFCPLYLNQDAYKGYCLKEKCQWWTTYKKSIIGNKFIEAKDCAIALIVLGLSE
uniref:Uncharacterized protein n=1 Tax=viral metagenome TaxID=1070528 RepID=A0A6M3LIA8_9ZZZZ